MNFFSGVIQNFCRAIPGRASRGLYGGRQIGYGNIVTFSEKKIRRTWKPNVQTKKIYSDLLGELKLRVTCYTLRNLDRYGGIDNYLLFSRIKDFGQTEKSRELAMDLRAKVIEKWEQKNGRKFKQRDEIAAMRKVFCEENPKKVYRFQP
eukprot:TRINITY_DN1329_c1_g2_i1.p1 TRINITY_DN1329_c1_g2~~TRINITY_DN1329_c1_g2_i1.p1  ORF type:complete len:149 (-),score=54.81 TRINITY_DN1329_c1_g2_i1:84-530(-)